MTHHASLLALFLLFVIAAILISEWAHQMDREQSIRPRLVRTIMIDTDAEIETKRGWE
ncbi:exported protein of unknown function [Hyphomicrobium sp. MC1]|nr:exported protein of unknown function [Hyphomicrobium sp. MC1]